MAAQVDTTAPGHVVELGPGTGKITRAILNHGVAAENLHMVELNGDFVPFLRDRFPGAHVHEGSAENLVDMGLTGASAVVSGLPLLSFSDELQANILRAVFDVLRPGGRYIQFTYGPRPPVKREITADLGLSVRRHATVFRNLPPASVYVYTRALN